MSTIHTGTTMAPTKLELLAGWLPRQPWYLGAGREPALARVGGFRLDDPAGEVGIELMLVADGGATTYAVPMTYRGGPLEGADDGLLGTSEHGVLGTRWIYDAVHDPVAVTQLLAFVCGDAEAQHQSRSDTADPSVGRAWSLPGRPVATSPLRVSDDASGRTTVAVDLPDGRPGSLFVVRRPGDDSEPAPGSVDVDWIRPDGSPARGRVVAVG